MPTTTDVLVLNADADADADGDGDARCARCRGEGKKKGDNQTLARLHAWKQVTAYGNAGWRVALVPITATSRKKEGWRAGVYRSFPILARVGGRGLPALVGASALSIGSGGSFFFGPPWNYSDSDSMQLMPPSLLYLSGDPRINMTTEYIRD